MRRFITAVCVMGLVGAGATVALAAMPPAHKSFSGSGGNYFNSGGAWKRNGTGSFHFTTSGRSYYGVKKFREYIRTFRGTYTTSCNSGTLTAGGSWILIHPNGTFNVTFRGTSTHGATLRIWGDFTSGGAAKVNYLVNFKGTDTNPATVNSSCATWVHGTAR